MAVTNELTKILKEIGFDFFQRSIARELTDLLLSSAQVGRLSMAVKAWATDWQQSEDQIWAVIDSMIKAGVWQIADGVLGQELVCTEMAGAEKAINKKRKLSNLRDVKEKAREERAGNMTLASTSLQNRSMFAQVATQIPREQRKEALRQPFSGWLPTATYGLNGLIYTPDAATIEKLGIDQGCQSMDIAMVMMYEDLRDHPKHRPHTESFVFWMRNWMKTNQHRLLVKDNAVQNNEIDTLLDTY